jgi:predicted nicotinamide N-methyase
VNAIRSSWTEAQVRKMLAEDDFSYQNIELPYGLSTGGADRSSTARHIFPDDMTGKTVLDLGSKFGYFCFEALKRGANRHLVASFEDPEATEPKILTIEQLGAPVRPLQVADN